MRALKFLFPAVWLSIVLWPAPDACAARAGNLFAAEVPVTEKSEEEKRRASSRALVKVLVKVTGDRQISRRDGAAALLADAESFIQQYRFTPNNTLLVGFDGRRLQQAMMQATLPVWSADRPATLIWLAVDEGGGERALISADDRGDVRTRIETTAAERGIPLVWPLNDTTDREQVTAVDVWGGYDDNIERASARYGADAVLVGRVRRSASGTFFGTWTLHVQGDKQEWRSGLASSVHRLTDHYATRLASVASPGGNSFVSMRISGVRDARAYAHAMSALEKLGAVERVNVVVADGDTLHLDLRIRGSREQLRRALAFSRVVAPESDDGADAFIYRYAW